MTTNDGSPKRTPEEARAAYLRNQQAVAAAASQRDGWLPLKIVGWVLAAATVVLFVCAVVSYVNNPQQEGPVDTTLPTLVTVALLAAAWCAIAPFLLEARSIGVRVRNVVIAAVITAILIPLGTGVMVELSSLIADLIGNLR